MKYFTLFFPLFFTLFFIIGGCSKMEEKKTSEKNQSPGKDKSNVPKTDSQTVQGNNPSGQKDEKAAELVKTADDAIATYAGDKSDGNKKEVLASSLEAANYLMFEANLPAREKYRPALKYYRKVLELEPKNEEALKNKKQIEDIYESMGMPIPQ